MLKRTITFALAVLCAVFASSASILSDQETVNFPEVKGLSKIDSSTSGVRIPSSRTFVSNHVSRDADGRILRMKCNSSSVNPLADMSFPDLRACISMCPGHGNNIYHWGAYNVSTMERFRYHMDLSANFGGTLLNDGKYFTTLVELDGNTIIYMECNVWNTLDEAIPYRNVATEVHNMVTGEGPAFNILAMGLCTDYLSGLVYGIFYTDDLQGFELATLDVEGFIQTGHIQRSAGIGKINVEPASLSCSSDGTLYMIDINGYLYTVNKSTAALTKVASTGMASPYYTDGAIDPKTDKYYFFHLPGEDMDQWTVKTIDLKNNYKVEMVAPLACEFGGAHVADRVVDEGVPGQPQNVTSNFGNGSLSGNVSFTVPATLYNGASATGSMTYYIYANDKMIKSGSASAGATINAGVTLPSGGKQRIIVYLTNDKGKSLNSIPLYIWGGNGQPLQPANYKAAINRNNNVTISWDAVSKGVLDGYIVPSDISYTIRRFKNDIPDATVAANVKSTSVIDRISPSDPTLTEYRYEITADFRGIKSDALLSNMVPVGYIQPPYLTEFDRTIDKDLYSIIDGGNDGYTWDWIDYYKRLGMSWDNRGKGVESDEWLITQPVMLKAGNAYTLSLNLFAYSSYNALQFFIGTSPEVSAMEPLGQRVFLQESNITPRTMEVSIIPDADGLYYLGLHHDFGISYVPEMTYSMATIELRSMEISEGYSLKAPNVVTDISSTPQYDGSNKIDIAFKAPAKSVEGGALASISKVEVYRDSLLTKTFENPAVGASLSFRDIAPENADYLYTFVAYNSYGKGYSVEKTMHVGVTSAMAPKDVVLMEDPDNEGYALITFTPIAKDINGFDIDPKLITYAITTQYEVIHYPISSSSPQVSLKVANDGTQNFYQFYVGAVTNGYLGGRTLSNAACIGTPDELPYLETFEGGLTASKISHVTTNYDHGNGYYWYVRVTDGYTNMPTGMETLQATSQDEGDGLIGWHPEYGRPYNTFRTTGKIALGDSDDVEFSYYYYAVPGLPDYSFYNYLICEGDTIQLNQKMNISNATERGWKQVRIPLKQWKGKNVQLGWYVECDAPKGFYENDYMWFGVFMMDNIQVRRWTDKDLNIRPVKAPETIAINDKGAVTVDVINEGRQASSAYRVELLRDGKKMTEKEMPPLPVNNRATASFEVVPDNFWGEKTNLSARVVWSDDQQSWNDTTKFTPVTIIQSILPGVTDLTGEIDYRKAKLSWTAHSNEPRLVDLVEDCEELGAFSLDPEAFGNWTVVDKKPEGAIMRCQWQEWPHSKEQQAWVVFDSEIYDSGYNNSSVDGSRKRLVSWDCTNMVSDNWLISPQLSGEAQTISFDAATWGYYAYEWVQVLYSSTDMNPDHFTLLNEYYLINAKEDEEAGDVTVRWQKIEENLPAGAKYFAIRNVTKGNITEASAVMVDNIKCRAYVTDGIVNGYNVYRDGEKLNGSLLNVSSYDEDNLLPDTYTYHVEAIYSGNRMSRLSNPAVLTVDEYRLSAGMQFSESFVNAYLDDEFEEPALTKDTDAEIIYSSNATEVATVDPNTGEVTLLKRGLVEIKAVAAGNELYQPGEATYSIRIREGSGVDSVEPVGIKVSSIPGYILVSGADGETVTIYDASGLQIWSEMIADKIRVPVTSGIYLVTTPSTSSKLIVK